MLRRGKKVGRVEINTQKEETKRKKDREGEAGGGRGGKQGRDIRISRE